MRRRTWLPAAGVAALLLAGCGPDDAADTEAPGDGAGQVEGATEDDDDGAIEGAVPEPEGSGADIEAVLQGPDGAEVGSVALTSTGDGTEVHVEVRDLPPGFHGLHVHAEPACEPDSQSPDGQTGDFLSAGGHLGAEEADHGEHTGDLPPLLVTAAGGGMLIAETDRFTVDDIEAAGGAALVVHSDRDNLAHIPERYGEPDEDTLGTGDAGDRIACAVLTE